MFQKLSLFSEVAVGMSLILIGAIGIREYLVARREHFEAKQAEELARAAAIAGVAGDAQVANAEVEEIFRPRSLSSAATEPPKPMRSRAVLVNGFLHGLSWYVRPGGAEERPSEDCSLTTSVP
eukprot:scaffold7595_cov267-Pinguiococcus_pyrenoidosus.AAC.1